MNFFFMYQNNKVWKRKQLENMPLAKKLINSFCWRIFFFFFWYKSDTDTIQIDPNTQRRHWTVTNAVGVVNAHVAKSVLGVILSLSYKFLQHACHSTHASLTVAMAQTCVWALNNRSCGQYMRVHQLNAGTRSMQLTTQQVVISMKRIKFICKKC